MHSLLPLQVGHVLSVVRVCVDVWEFVRFANYKLSSRWVCGCAGVRVCGCAGVWMYEYVGVGVGGWGCVLFSSGRRSTCSLELSP